MASPVWALSTRPMMSCATKQTCLQKQEQTQQHFWVMSFFHDQNILSKPGTARLCGCNCARKLESKVLPVPFNGQADIMDKEKMVNA